MHHSPLMDLIHDCHVVLLENNRVLLQSFCQPMQMFQEKVYSCWVRLSPMLAIHLEELHEIIKFLSFHNLDFLQKIPHDSNAPYDSGLTTIEFSDLGFNSVIQMSRCSQVIVRNKSFHTQQYIYVLIHDGELITWNTFWDSFEIAIHNGQLLSDIENLTTSILRSGGFGERGGKLLVR